MNCPGSSLGASRPTSMLMSISMPSWRVPSLRLVESGGGTAASASCQAFSMTSRELTMGTPNLDPVRDSASSALGASRMRISEVRDRKSTRLNSSHLYISYAVFCLKKKHRRERYGHPAGFAEIVGCRRDAGQR